MQQIMMHRIMFGAYIPPMSGFKQPPQPLPNPFIVPPTPSFFIPPPPPPAAPATVALPLQQPELVNTPSSSMDVNVDYNRTASPSSTTSFSTYFESRPTSPMTLDDVDQRSTSPSIFAGLNQNGQDMLWHLQQNLNDASTNDGEDVDDDVVYVGRYQRSEDVQPPIADTTNAMRLTELELRARAAEQRAVEAEIMLQQLNNQRSEDVRSPIANTTNAMHLADLEQRVRAAEQRAVEAESIIRQLNGRTSCPVCTDDLLQCTTLRLPCGHICCEDCLISIAQRARHQNNTPIRCPECRRHYTLNNCLPIIFP